MKIAVDCRYIGKSGIGRVCEGLLHSLDYDAHEFFLIGKKEDLQNYPKAQIVPDDSEPYSFSGLRSFDKKLNRICDALIIPNFLIPFGVKIPIYSVMHDLIFLDVKETTRGWKDKLIKKILLKRCMKKSASISCDSAFTLSRCENYFKKYSRKCYVNYVGIPESVLRYAHACPKPSEKGRDFVFVGNVKKHKGLELLLSAFSELKDGSALTIIGEKEHFLTGLQLSERQYENVFFTGKIEDEQLFSLIQKAKYLILPSKYEGFGLPPLEALCLGTQPIVSDIPVFREVYEGLPVKFFRTRDELIQMLRSEPDPIDALWETEKRFRFDAFAKKIISEAEGNIHD